MQWLQLFISFAVFWKMGNPMRCYNCIPMEDIYFCQYFNTSAHYTTDCPKSTMCYKRVITQAYPGLSKTIETIERGCASQSQTDEQRKIGRTWQYVDEIYEVYEEACQETSEDNKFKKTIQCYCRGDLCNGSPSYKNVFLFTIVLCLVLHILH